MKEGLVKVYTKYAALMVKTFREKLNGTFTTIMAGSALLWVQTRRELSSDALNHHCLFRLQLTLLTGLSCPERKRHICNLSGIILVITF